MLADSWVNDAVVKWGDALLGAAVIDLAGDLLAFHTADEYPRQVTDLLVAQARAFFQGGGDVAVALHAAGREAFTFQLVAMETQRTRHWLVPTTADPEVVLVVVTTPDVNPRNARRQMLVWADDVAVQR